MVLKSNDLFLLDHLQFSSILVQVCLEADVGEVDQIFSRFNGLLLLSGDYKHSARLSDGPSYKQKFLTDFFDARMEDKG